MKPSRDRRPPWPMYCAHVLVVALLLAAVGPATDLPPLLATGLVGGALVALCVTVPWAVTVCLAVAGGLLLELAYHAGAGAAAEPVDVYSAARAALLTALAFGVVAVRRRARTRAA